MSMGQSGCTDENLLLFAMLSEELNFQSLHPVDRLALRRHLASLENAVRAHPLFGEVFSYEVDTGFLNQATMRTLRLRIHQSQMTATVEAELERARPEKEILESFENWLFETPSGPTLSAQDLTSLLIARAVSISFLESVENAIERWVQLKSSAIEGWRGPPEGVEDLKHALSYFIRLA